ncbi:MAG: tyrosine-type recombinase/integrase [Chloroflexi bacterium]|nr:tyrosine-type recombinase/integrase [Chloroflexota bacterium]
MRSIDIEVVQAQGNGDEARSSVPVPDQRLVPVAANRQGSADQHPAMVYLASLAPGSRRGVRSSLQICAELLSSGSCDWQSMPWQALGPQHTRALRSELASRYAAVTANKMLAAVRGVLRAGWELGQVDTDRYQRAIAFRAVRGQTLPRGRSISQGELRALFSACMKDRTPLGSRDAALLAVLYGSGLRRAEAVALDVGDYDQETGSLTIRAGKGNKARVSYTSSSERQLLEAWLKVRAQEGAPASAGPLFLTVLKGGHVKLRRLDSRTVLVIAQRRARAAGCKHLTPHDFRRSMISDLLDAGADLSTVQRLAGHAQVGTTARYDRRGEGAKRKAAELLHIPLEE